MIATQDREEEEANSVVYLLHVNQKAKKMGFQGS